MATRQGLESHGCKPGRAPRASEGARPRRFLDLGLLASRPWEEKFLLFPVTKFVARFSSSNRTQPRPPTGSAGSFCSCVALS